MLGAAAPGQRQLVAQRRAVAVFEADERVKHQLFRLPARRRRHGYPTDPIPFGGIEDPAATIAWPPELGNRHRVLTGYSFGLRERPNSYNGRAKSLGAPTYITIERR